MWSSDHTGEPMQRFMTPADDIVGTPSSANRFSDLAERGGLLSLQFVAHELNTLLDGSMRRLRLAKHSLSPSAADDAAASATIHLDAAEAAMSRMARLLEQTMQQASTGPKGATLAPSRLFSSSISLADAVAEALQDLEPRANEAAVEIRVWKKSAEGRLGPSRTSR